MNTELKNQEITIESHLGKWKIIPTDESPKLTEKYEALLEYMLSQTGYTEMSLCLNSAQINIERSNYKNDEILIEYFVTIRLLKKGDEYYYAAQLLA